MTDVVSIGNLALSHVGDRATLTSIDPPEGSAQADHVAQWWPIARDEALAKFDWRFASHVTSTAEIAEASQTNPQWLYAYQLPVDYLVAREFAFEEGAWLWYAPGDVQFELGTIDNGTQVLFCNLQDMAIRYTRRVSDPTKYPPGFVTAVSYLLASYLAGPVIKGRMAVQQARVMRDAYDRLIGAAAVTDANQRRTKGTFTPGGVAARGASNDRRVLEVGPYRHSLPFWSQP